MLQISGQYTNWKPATSRLTGFDRKLEPSVVFIAVIAAAGGFLGAHGFAHDALLSRRKVEKGWAWATSSRRVVQNTTADVGTPGTPSGPPALHAGNRSCGSAR